MKKLYSILAVILLIYSNGVWAIDPIVETDLKYETILSEIKTESEDTNYLKDLQKLPETPKQIESNISQQDEPKKDPFLFEFKAKNADEKPLLVAVFMVKNEEHVMVPTLEPYVKSGIKHFFIYDTGSKDDTVKVTQEYLSKNDMQEIYIAQEPWIDDFAYSRNRALELAEEKFPNAAFLLMPDAEWYLKNGEDLLEFCKKNATPDINDASTLYPCYLIRIISSNEDFYHPRLFRRSAKIRFQGEIHEAPHYGVADKAPGNIFFDLRSSIKGAQKTKARFHRDREILSKKFEKNPNDSRTAFYLAQTHECLGNVDDAIKYYQIRLTLDGWAEEDYLAQYRLASLMEVKLNTDKSIEWSVVLDNYLKAHNMRPHRAEPLYKIAEYYWKDGKFALCYLFAKRAMDMAYPKDEFLAVEIQVYDYCRYESVSKSAWYAQEYEVGQQATLKALEARPGEPQLYRNLACYLEKTGTKLNTDILADMQKRLTSKSN